MDAPALNRYYRPRSATHITVHEGREVEWRVDEHPDGVEWECLTPLSDADYREAEGGLIYELEREGLL